MVQINVPPGRVSHPQEWKWKVWKSKGKRSLTPPPEFQRLCRPLLPSGPWSTRLCQGTSLLGPFLQLPWADCRLSEQTGSERSLPCLRSHSTAPPDSQPLSPPLRSCGPTQGCGPEPFGEWACALCATTFRPPFPIAWDRQAHTGARLGF